MFSARDSPSGSSPQAFTMQMSPQSGEIQFAPALTHTKKINSFASWMEAWNVYAGTILSAKPSRALEFFGYQRIITSLNLSLSLSSWMTYDIRFRTLTASHPSLCWAVRHLDTWIDCIPMPKAQPERWPGPHSGSMQQIPDCCPFRSNTRTNPPNRQLPTIGANNNNSTIEPTSNVPNNTFNIPCQQSLPPIC